MAGNTPVKSFVSSAISTLEGEENERTTDIDGVEVTFTLPDINQVVMSTAMIENASSNIASAAALINIFFGLIKGDETYVDGAGDPVDPDDEDAELIYNDFVARKLQAKMMDPRDPFGIEVIAAVMSWLLEEWSDRPTTPSSRSSVSPKQSGTTSKVKPRGEGSTRGTTARSARGARS